MLRRAATRCMPRRSTFRVRTAHGAGLILRAKAALFSFMASPFYVYRICLVATLGGVLFGYDTAVISGVVDALKAHFHLGAIPLGSVIGSALIGCIIGVLIAGK